MHSFLFISNDNTLIAQEIHEICKKLSVTPYDHAIKKIEDVRSLMTFVKLKVNSPTAIVIKDIDQATTASMNAFLKSLEEPQSDVYYLLTARNEKALLPTIVSRCQIIRLQNTKKTTDKAKEFFQLTPAEKLIYIAGIRTRDQAIEFNEEVLTFAHTNLVNDNPKTWAKIAYWADITLNRLKANGNVQSQLTNLVINLVQYLPTRYN